MLSKLREKLRAFKASPAGKRFQTVHDQQADAPAWVKPVVVVGAVVALGIAIVLTFLPGPGIVFYALAGALAAIRSARVARALDRGEVVVRRLAARLWPRGSKPAPTPRKLGTSA